MSQHPEHDPFRDLPRGPRQPNDETPAGGGDPAPHARGRETLHFGQRPQGEESPEHRDEERADAVPPAPASFDTTRAPEAGGVRETGFSDAGGVSDASNTAARSSEGFGVPADRAERVSPLEEYRRAREASMAAESEPEVPGAGCSGVIGPGLSDSQPFGCMLGSNESDAASDGFRFEDRPEPTADAAPAPGSSAREEMPPIDRVAFEDPPVESDAVGGIDRMPADECTPRPQAPAAPECASFRVETATPASPADAPRASDPVTPDALDPAPPAPPVPPLPPLPAPQSVPEETAPPEPASREPEPEAVPERTQETAEPVAATPHVPEAPKFRPMTTPAKREEAQQPVHPHRLVEQMGAQSAAKQQQPTPAPKATPPTQYRPLHAQEFQTARPDVLRQPNMVKRGRGAHLPRIYGFWWLATLVLFVLGAGLGAHHGLEYFGFDLWTLTMTDLQDKHVFLVLGGSLLASLFVVWGLQNVAKGSARHKPNPSVAFNNMYGLLVCLSIVVGMKFASDVVSTEALADDLADLAWLRGEEPADAGTSPRVVTPAPVQTDAATTGTPNSGNESPADREVAEPAPNMVSPFEKPKPETVISLSGGRNGGSSVTSSGGRHTEVRAGDPTKAVMAGAIRSFQSAAGRVRTADRVVSETPQPDLSTVATPEPIEAVAAAHREAFAAHRALSRLASDLPNTSRLQMLEAGASVRQTDAQVASLSSLLNLKGAAVLHDAEASVHAARGAYASFLAENFGAWRVEQGTVRFDDDEDGATASRLQSAIGDRERDLQDAKLSLFEG